MNENVLIKTPVIINNVEKNEVNVNLDNENAIDNSYIGIKSFINVVIDGGENEKLDIDESLATIKEKEASKN